MAKAAVNPFAAAAKKTTSVLKSKSPIYVASAVVGPDGQVIYDKDEVIAAVNNVAEGVRLEDMGKSMKEQNRPIVTQFAMNNFVRDWVSKGSRPENPKVVTNDIGDGVFCGVSFVDSAKKLDDAQYGQLAALVGPEQAEDCVIRRHDFMINPDVLDQTTKVNKGGKVVEQNVMEALTEALQEKFGGVSDALLATLFQAVEKFETKKGTLDRALELVGKAPDRVAQFIEATRTTISLKPGGTPK